MNTMLFFHAGMNKTATTTLQRQVFKPSLGDNYVDCREWGVHRFQKGRFCPTQPILISDEAALGVTIFTRQQCRNSQRRDFLENWSRLHPQTKFILCFRRHDGFLVSLYRQYIQLGGTLAPAEFFNGTENAYIKAGELEYMPLVEELQSLFPHEHFFFDFADFCKSPASVVQAIGKFIGVRLDVANLDRTENKSVGFKYLEALRFLNRYVASQMHPDLRVGTSLFRFLALGSTPRRLFQKISESEKSSDIPSRYRFDLPHRLINDWQALACHLYRM